jgi:hypothetical protein
MKRQLIISSLCLVLLLVMMLSTTLAWFTDSKANVNTMVAGKISIAQKEYSDTNHTVEFENNKYVMMPSQSITKEVVVTNTGNQPAYVRTLFAFEDKSYTDENGVQKTVLEMLTTAGKTIEFPANKVQFTVTKNGKTTTYTVGYYVHPTALSHEDDKDDITVLNSITLNGAATNEWQTAVGDDYELFVLSQASQVSGLDNLGVNGAESPAAALDKAFAPITGDWCATWFAKVLGGTATGNAITINP